MPQLRTQDGFWTHEEDLESRKSSCRHSARNHDARRTVPAHCIDCDTGPQDGYRLGQGHQSPRRRSGLFRLDNWLALVLPAPDANAMWQLRFVAVRAGAEAWGLQEVVGSATVATSLGVTTLRIRHGVLLERIRIEQVLETSEARVRVLGWRARARHRVAIGATGWAPAQTGIGTQRLHGNGEDDLLPHDLAEVQLVASVVGDHHVAVRKLDLFFRFISCARSLGEKEKVNPPRNSQGEVLEAPAALQRDLGCELAADMNSAVVGPLDVTSEPAAGIQAKLRLAVDP
jgi:hypothetical protein